MDLQAILDAGGPWQQARIIGGQLLIQGDCREVMATLPKVCAVVADPPYGIGYVHSGKSGSSAKWHKAKRAPILNDDKPFDPFEMMMFSEILIWGADHYRERLPSGGRFLAWSKLGEMPSMQDSFSNVEFAWHSKKGRSDIVSVTWKGLIKTGSGENGRETFHPSQKPVKVMEWCISQVSDARTILDPFMGSGTTLVACQRLGRQGIGIELDADYFEIACKRVQEVVNNPPLFTPAPPKPTQGAMDL